MIRMRCGKSRRRRWNSTQPLAGLGRLACLAGIPFHWRRLMRLDSSTLAVLVVLIGLEFDSAAQDLAAPRLKTVRGAVQAVVEDHFDTQSSKLSYSIQLDGLYMPVLSPTARIRAAARTGEPVTLLGFRSRGVFYPQPEGVEAMIDRLKRFYQEVS